MHYTYILLSSKSHKFYFGSTNDLRSRFQLHNASRVTSTKPGVPWKLIWYAAFSTEKEARDFELYLKSGSGKPLAYKRLISEAFVKTPKIKNVFASVDNAVERTVSAAFLMISESFDYCSRRSNDKLHKPALPTF